MFCPRSRCPLAFGQSIHLRSIGTLGFAISSLIPSLSCRRCSPNAPAGNADSGTAVIDRKDKGCRHLRLFARSWGCTGSGPTLSALILGRRIERPVRAQSETAIMSWAAATYCS
jgi:hypothetical protein